MTCDKEYSRSDASQLFDALDPATLAGLRDSVQRLGVLVPVAKDQHGNMLDGHHRKQVADELGVKYRVDVIQVADEVQANEIRHTLNVDRRQLSGEDLRRYLITLADLRTPSGAGALSQPEIAERGGVDQTYVGQVLRREAELRSTTKLPPLPERRVGRDGKERPSTRPAVVTAKSEREAERAQSALTQLPDVGGRTMDVKRVERVAREHTAEQRRAEPLEATTDTGGVEIRLGDFRDVLDLEVNSVDAIITDPPYPRRFWEPYSEHGVYEYLGALAARLLKPNGVLAVMIGTRLEMLDAVDTQIGKYVRRRHRGIYLVPGQRWRDQTERVATGYKPILIYSHPEATDLRWINDDVFRSDAGQQDERFHHWGQTESGFASIVERLTEPGALVVDPFLGGGTTAVVCRDLGRRFIGCDIDAAAVSTSRERLG
jgi:ParB-like chromosome segregation protein Spo0J